MLWFKYSHSFQPATLKKESIPQLLSPLQGLQYSINGGAALMLHNIRPTQDLDVFIHPDDIGEAVDRYRAIGAKIAQITPVASMGRELGGFTVSYNGHEIDLMTSLDQEHPWLNQSIQESHKSPYGNILSPTWLLLTKMLSMRDKDVNDYQKVFTKLSPIEKKNALRLIRQQFPDLEDDFKTMKLIDKYSPELLAA